MKQMGLSVSAISEVTGYDRKTVRRYLLEPEGVPSYGPRTVQPSKLDPHKPYLEDRMKAGVWNAQVLLRELRRRGYGGGYTILKDWLHPQRVAAGAAAVRRFETPPGKQAQVDWGHLADRSLSRLLGADWPRTLEELEDLRRHPSPRPVPNE
jgi:transposase